MSARGQATVELALGLLIFVTVLIFGIHFAEMGFLSLKVTEASASAIWDATAYQTHSKLPNSNPSAGVARAQADAQRRYQDFDGRESATNSTTLTEVFTTARNMQVRCRTGGSVGLDWDPVVNPLWQIINDNNGMSCMSEADLANVRIPRRFMDQSDGFFTEAHLVRTSPTHICSLGRAINGTCNASYQMLVDDWGLEMQDETGQCPTNPAGVCTTNMTYWNVAGQFFFRNGAGQGVAADNFAMQVVGADPMFFMTNQFYMSYMGEETLFTQPLWVGEGSPIWQTTPFLEPVPTYSASYFERRGNGGCYLGKPCDFVYR